MKRYVTQGMQFEARTRPSFVTNISLKKFGWNLSSSAIFFFIDFHLIPTFFPHFSVEQGFVTHEGISSPLQSIVNENYPLLKEGDNKEHGVRY